jgi:hypothetical protein
VWLAMSTEILVSESNPIAAPSPPSLPSPSQGATTSSPPSLTTAQLDLLYGQTLSVIIPEELYLSDYQAARDEKLLTLLGITHIVNASNGTVPNQFPQRFQYFDVATISSLFKSTEPDLEEQDEVRRLDHAALRARD